MRLTPPLLRFILNIYGPSLWAGIRADYISADWRSIRVSMKLRWYNRNAVGTHFGGSLYSMVDPHLMLMLMNILGSGYVVWDKSAAIDFLRPAKGERLRAKGQVIKAGKRQVVVRSDVWAESEGEAPVHVAAGDGGCRGHAGRLLV